MLLKDKYSPKFLEEFEINKGIAIKYKEFFSKDYIPHTIIHGANGVGKYIFIKAVINTIFETNVICVPNSVIIDSKEIKFLVSTYHFEIIFNKYNFNILKFCKIIDYLTESKNINKTGFKIFIIKLININNKDIYSFIKKKIENCYNNYRFLIITNNITNMKYFKGLFHFVRIPMENKDIIKSFFKKHVSDINVKLLDSVCKDRNNLNELFINYELGLVCKTKSFITQKKNKIIKLIKDSITSPLNILKIRGELYEINIKNIDIVYFMKQILDYYIKSDLSNKKKMEICNKYADFSSIIPFSYKIQIHVETLISNIIIIYHTE
jgi:DNA polymerase III delta prime subunit